MPQARDPQAEGRLFDRGADPSEGGRGGSIPGSGQLSSRDILYFNIAKNTSSTLTGLSAAGDYAHATTTVSSNTAQNYSVGGGGLSLNSSISGYYDSIQSAVATMSVYW